MLSIDFFCWFPYRKKLNLFHTNFGDENKKIFCKIKFNLFNFNGAQDLLC